eukprot:CAMPEP_0185761344 /NCGR_PEP_ID=MMETSP1174-20130828/20256_1 /TAXON_ID=35687 /ORGANISM="Dictyocha speculum, Strain CCMP1381" /LENGTH=74 /DNA_ID=CAMNT_0028442531 /DNA_START=37 /DNA_END=257 /DNA_ORIENTATION=-
MDQDTSLGKKNGEPLREPLRDKGSVGHSTQGNDSQLARRSSTEGREERSSRPMGVEAIDALSTSSPPPPPLSVG